MEAYYAHIVNDVVVSVEVVTKKFVKDNPNRYSGKWIKVGDSKRAFCGKGYLYLSKKNKIIPSSPFPSWKVDKDSTWQPPIKKPNGDYYWDELSLKWVLNS